MAERVLLVTGSLAEERVRRTAEALRSDAFDPQVANVGIKVAALMTAEILERRLSPPEGMDRVLLPGRFRGDLDRLSQHFGVPFQRGPEEIADLPEFFGRGGAEPDLSRHDCLIFAEIVDAPRLDVAGIVARSHALRADGADVIDLGGLPDVAFPHLEEAIAALKADGARVSVDSADRDELARGNRAGADYLLSLTEETLDIADEGAAVPILIPAQPGDMASLHRAIEAMRAASRSFYADPILDPIHFGFTASVCRYATLREAYPEIEILMGVGNVTELTDADTTGMNALLMGMVSELSIRAILAVQVSPHCRTVVREIDRARREMFAARELGSLPQRFGGGLMALRERRPFASTPDEVAKLAGEIRDRNYRIEAAEDGVHVFNRDGHHVATDPFDLYPRLGVEDDAAHAFYLGVETARAEIAQKLGKRYAQDEGLDWGVVAHVESEGDPHRLTFKQAGSTLRTRREKDDRSAGQGDDEA